MKVEMLAADLAHARRARPDLSEDALVGAALERGLRLAAQPIEARVPNDLPATERLRRLRTLFATTAALVAEMRTRLVLERERFERAATSERSAFMEHVELDRDVVPPLKLEAKRLRVALQQLEAEAEARGIDTADIEPRIDWPNTLAVDTYEPPTYVSNESRRRAATAFFRRNGER
jgi:hypothetical protein